MNTKQDNESITNPLKPINTIDLHNTNGSLSQYLIYNLFRILRPIRHKFNLTINEIIIINGMILYNKFVGTSFSYSGILRYVGYFNDKKMRYYIKSLLGKGMIEVSDIFNGKERYKLTLKGINTIEYIEEYYNRCLDEYCLSNGISL